ncbi:amidohydrolase family protein [Dermatophilus congolensis]|uniref:amidohydrolase family protein n=1 Tax=Dermatophilus congolensis TaxID=1863 RepID=UPI0003FC26A5|nr:amidohydrolase family protein [Dermatophilus congolensis]
MSMRGVGQECQGRVLHLTGRINVSADDVRDEVWVVGGRITFTRPVGVEVERISGHVLPGLVDAHCHVGLESQGAVERGRALEHALAERDAGVLLIRDAGSPADTRWLDERGDLPRIVRAGRHIARTKRYIRNYAHEVEPELLVECVRGEARRGDGWVKLVGDWIDRQRGDLSPCWPVEVLGEAVEVAHAEGARVTAHCFAEQSLRDCVTAGVDCVEHATGLVADTIEAFARAGVAIVPTLVNIANFPDFARAGRAKFPSYAAHMLDLYGRRYETVSAAHEAGVAIYAGTDAGGRVPHGLLALEVVELAKTRLGNVGAVGAASWAARSWLGYPGIEEGAPADLVVYLDDPREDVRVLVRPHCTVLGGVVW